MDEYSQKPISAILTLMLQMRRDRLDLDSHSAHGCEAELLFSSLVNAGQRVYLGVTFP